MPQIKEYNQQTELPGPVQGVNPNANDFSLAPGIKALGAGVTEAGDAAQKIAETTETSDMHAKLSQLHLQMTQDWHDHIMSADPNDPNYKNLVSDYLQRYDDASSEIRDGLSTRAGVARYNETNTNLRTTLGELAINSQAHLAGEKALLDKQTELKNYGDAALLNPNGADASMQALKNSIYNDANLDSATKEKTFMAAAADLTQNQARGYIRLNPQKTLEAINGGAFSKYMNGDQLHEIAKEANVAINAQYTEEERRLRVQKQALEAKQDVIQKDMLKSLMADKLSSDDVLYSAPGKVLDFHQQKAMLNMMGVINEKGGVDKLRTDPVFFRGMLDRMMLDPQDPRYVKGTDEIFKGVVDGHLSPHDADWLSSYYTGKHTLQGQMEMKEFESFMQNHKSDITTSDDIMHIKDKTGGDDRWYEFSNMAMNEILKKKAAGQSLQPLLDPKSPDYLGNRIGKYQRTYLQTTQAEIDKMNAANSQPLGTGTPQQPLGSNAQSPAGPPAPPAKKITLPKKNKNETDAEYFNRIGH